MQPRVGWWYPRMVFESQWVSPTAYRNAVGPQVAGLVSALSQQLVVSDLCWMYLMSPWASCGLPACGSVEGLLLHALLHR